MARIKVTMDVNLRNFILTLVQQGIPHILKTDEEGESSSISIERNSLALLIRGAPDDPDSKVMLTSTNLHTKP